MAKSHILQPNGVPSEVQHIDHATELYAESVRLADAAALLPVEQWSQAQRFAVCVLAGAALCYRDGELQTRYPCNITPKPSGGWTVTEVAPPPRSTETEGRVSVPPPPNLPASILAANSGDCIIRLKECPECGGQLAETLMSDQNRQICHKCDWQGEYGKLFDSGAVAKPSSL